MHSQIFIKIHPQNFSTIHPKNRIFTILRPRLLQLWYMESYRNITMNAPTVFDNTCTIVMMTDNGNLNENIMQTL